MKAAWPIALLLFCVSAASHPLGNSTVNRQAAIRVTPAKLELRYTLDMAEIPTLLAIQDADLDQDGWPSEAEWQAHSLRFAEQVSGSVQITFAERDVPLALKTHRWSLKTGEAGLSILRLEAQFGAPLRAGAGVLHYRDQRNPGEAGWKEIYVSAAEGASVFDSTVSNTDRSKTLTDFSLPSGTEPPNELAARAEIRFSTWLRESAAGSTWLSRAGVSHVPPRSTQTHTLENPAPASASPRERSWIAQAWAFFRLGMHHIATGWDHLVFLFGLLLLSRNVKHLIKVVTAFTLAHSLTLALAANGWVTPPGALVEPLIALTIAYVGLVALLWRQSRHGAWLAFGFGLVHGFGFAGALAESLSARPDHWLVSLASFNLGIEAIQVLLVLLTVPLLAAAARSDLSVMAQRAASLAVLGVGAGWFVVRTVELLA